MPDTEEKLGALPVNGTGLSQAEPEVSALRASIPSAVRIVSVEAWASVNFTGARILLEGIELPEDAAIEVKGAILADHFSADGCTTCLLVNTSEDQPASRLAANLITALRTIRASGIAARSDETAQQAQPERQEPGPSGDAQPFSPGGSNA